MSMPDVIDENSLKNMEAWQIGGFPVSSPYTSDFILTPAGVTDIIPLQDVVARWLATLTGCRVLEMIGDIESLGMLKALADDERKTMTKVMGSRLPGECKRIVNRYGISSFMNATPFLRS